MANTEEIMSKFEETKSFFEEKIDKFIMKDDFSETFKTIDESLESYQQAIFEQSDNMKKLKDELRMTIERLNKKSENSRVDKEFK